MLESSEKSDGLLVQPQSKAMSKSEPGLGFVEKGMFNTHSQCNNDSPPQVSIDSSPFCRSAQSRDAGRDSKKRKKIVGSLNTSAHQVNFTVTIAIAIPRPVDNSSGGRSSRANSAKHMRRIVDAPPAQSYYHCEYYLLPDDDDAVKTDIVTFGVAAKIFAERQDPKVLKTWMEGDQSWIAWSHCHPVVLTDEVLMKLFKHTLNLRIWDTRDKLSTRAKFDRPKAFRLPQTKPGEDSDGGVKPLVMKQSNQFEALQPKKSYVTWPLPTQFRPCSATSSTSDRKRSASGKRGRKNKKKPGTRDGNKRGAEAAPGTVVPPTSTGVFQTYEHLVDLAGKDHHGARGSPRISSGRSSASPKPSRRKSVSPTYSNQPSDARKYNKLPPLAPCPADYCTVKGESFFDKKVHHKSTKPHRSKIDPDAAAAAEHIKKHGIACVSIPMSYLFSGMQSVTQRVDKPAATLLDMFVTVTVNEPIMSEEQKKKLNPLVIKVHSATNMPNTPLNYTALTLRCAPAYVKYKFLDEPVYRSIGRGQDKAIYWDDTNVILAGIMDQGELHEYLNGPAMDIEVHDRDQLSEKQKSRPVLFGDDIEDQKISNVCAVTSKRSIHNPFLSRDQPWDPYGVARIDMSGLLLGQKVLYLQVPVHSCVIPDVLGLRPDDSGGGLLGVAGATDGPTENPLAMGHYMEAHSMLKVRVEITNPLITPAQIAAKEPPPGSELCPFGRIIFKFSYTTPQIIQRLVKLVMELNASALQIDTMPQPVVESALSTYKLSLDQQQSLTLDIVTGFQIMDGMKNMFILEGMKEGAIKILWKSIPTEENSEMEVLYNSDLSFHERLYGPLDVDLSRVKLHEPLDVIMQQPLLYVRDMVPEPCFFALSKIHQIQQAKTMREIVRNGLFPTAEMVSSMSREFGVPLTVDELDDIQPEEDRVSTAQVHFVEVWRTSRPWTPIDNINFQWMNERNKRESRDKKLKSSFIKLNMEAVQAMSLNNTKERSKTSLMTIKSNVAVAHNYSTQALNSTEQAKSLLREQIKESNYRFTYCPDFHHSMTVLPDDMMALLKEDRLASIERWKTPAGWNFPGKKTMIQSNEHPKKPHPSRVADVHQEWVENTLHMNVLEPTLDRDRLMWEQRQNDFDVWSKAVPVFGHGEPISIYLAGEKLKEERLVAQKADQEQWMRKVIVGDEHMHFHRCALETEATDRGLKARNQIGLLKGMLKDAPQKLSLYEKNMVLDEMSSLGVVMNPQVDTARRSSRRQLPSPMDNWDNENETGFMPGPYEGRSLMMEKNKIPIQNYEHMKFQQINGYDFDLYNNPHSSLYTRPIMPLTDDELNSFTRSANLTQSQNHITTNSDVNPNQYTQETVQLTKLSSLPNPSTEQKALETC